jgi:hypothetical protein
MVVDFLGSGSVLMDFPRRHAEKRRHAGLNGRLELAGPGIHHFVEPARVEPLSKAAVPLLPLGPALRPPGELLLPFLAAAKAIFREEHLPKADGERNAESQENPVVPGAGGEPLVDEIKEGTDGGVEKQRRSKASEKAGPLFGELAGFRLPNQLGGARLREIGGGRLERLAVDTDFARHFHELFMREHLALQALLPERPLQDLGDFLLCVRSPGRVVGHARFLPHRRGLE